MVKKIAIEEHCLFPGLLDYWAPTVVDLPASKREAFLGRLTDFGGMRLETMDKAGIERCVLSVAGPGGRTGWRTRRSG
jgi:2,3-dihydroxybenzoate decarboxylase